MKPGLETGGIELAAEGYSISSQGRLVPANDWMTGRSCNVEVASDPLRGVLHGPCGQHLRLFLPDQKQGLFWHTRNGEATLKTPRVQSCPFKIGPQAQIISF